MPDPRERKIGYSFLVGLVAGETAKQRHRRRAMIAGMHLPALSDWLRRMGFEIHTEHNNGELHRVKFKAGQWPQLVTGWWCPSSAKLKVNWLRPREQHWHAHDWTQVKDVLWKLIIHRGMPRQERDAVVDPSD